MSKVDQLSQEILRELLSDFGGRRLSSADLSNGYQGMSVAALKQKLCQDGSTSDVDFDLALKDLTHADLVDTGPLVPYDNPPNSAVFVVGLFSKMEYAYLTEKGYKAAQKAARAPKPGGGAGRVYISGGTFNQSPIGIGEHFTQSIHMKAGDGAVFEKLRKAIDESSVNGRDRGEIMTRIAAMEAAHETGGFVQRYQEFITCAANHMTLIAPFLPALAAPLK